MQKGHSESLTPRNTALRRQATLSCCQRGRRRGVIMVFVLGMLTLLAIVGIVLIARTHGESERVLYETAADSSRAAMNGVIHGIQDTLRRDIWGPPPTGGFNPLAAPLDNRGAGIEEKNEPWDAPGTDDRWLASTTPYAMSNEDAVNPNPGDNPRARAYLDATNNTVYEDLVLAWPSVSYLGTDIIQQPSSSNPFMWPPDSRRFDLANLVRYDVDNLSNVPILQTPPQGAIGRLIPGSTTNRTIAQARADWQAINWGAVAPPPPAGIIPQFPYFDTNQDGIVDLYDADGDGIPDSPLSFPISLENGPNNKARRLYVAVRIVDHASMVNVNTASSMKVSAGNNVNNLMFDESLSNLQRRGRRLTEVLLDDVVRPKDAAFADNQTMGLAVSYRGSSDPVAYDLLLRSQLVGGPPDPTFNLYAGREEASLRRRGLLVPYERSQGNMTGIDMIDSTLPSTLLWSRTTGANNAYAGVPKWTRFDATSFQPGAPAAAPYEGYDNAVGLGWRKLLREDDPWAIRRHFVTTVSHDVAAPPANIVADPGSPGGIVGLPLDLPAHRATFVNLPNVFTGSPDYSLMRWPTIDPSTIFNPCASIPPWMRVLQVDLNMRDPVNPNTAKRDFILHSAAVIYKALEGVSNFQGITLSPDDPTTPVDEQLNRDWLAWQFALNLADYRDADDEPTALEWPSTSGRYLFGIEKQPFLTEAFARLEAGEPPGPSGFQNPGMEDKWFHAAELYVPPFWSMPTANLHIRLTSSAAGGVTIPLTAFQRIVGGQTPVLDGGATGLYLVLCGPTTNPPPGMVLDSFYRNNQFDIPTNGSGRVELVWAPDPVGSPNFMHVLDVIGPEYTGGHVGSGNTGGNPPNGTSEWCKRPTTPPPNQGDTFEFSLRRSTKGWRFTTAWQRYSLNQQPAAVQDPYFEESLGGPNLPNSLAGDLDDFVPESVWPVRVAGPFTGTLGSATMPTDGFAANEPYSVFDSPGELSRIFLIGSVRLLPGIPPVFDADDLATGAAEVPATGVLASLLNMSANEAGDLNADMRRRVSAGRPDCNATGAAQPWAWRLFNYFTTQSPLWDGVDNDGDGAVDFYADPLEATKVLNRHAGRININTAPATVLRGVPFVSVLPTSSEYIFNVLGGAIPASYSAVDEYFTAPKRFWDMATAIVAKREDRAVSLRLPDGTGAMQTVALAGQSTGPQPSQPPPTSTNAFTSIGQLAQMTLINDLSPGGNNALFRIDRFLPNPVDPALVIGSHKLAGNGTHPDLGVLDPISPDFRYGRLTSNEYIADYVPVEFSPSTDVETTGIRARDIFLARWANLLTTRSDVFTAYIALIDEDGHYVQRSQVTLDRSECFREDPRNSPRVPVYPEVLLRMDSGYTDDLK